ncbi:UNVERIFIED_CONTAM: two-component system response regulator DctR [Brevibacillus sp. OAP136]
MNNLHPIRVLIIEDDPMVQEVNRQFVEQVQSFEVVGIAGNGAEGIRMVRELRPDLVIMDVFMPIQDGVQTLQQLRAEGEETDVIVITAAKDKETIQSMVRNGAMDYLIKPFKFERLKQALEAYRSYRKQMEQDGSVSQADLDQLLFRKAGVPQREVVLDSKELPKGLLDKTMEQIVQQLSTEKAALSAEEVAERIGIARVTARRYLEFLEKSGRVKRDVEYGGVGRPTNRYVIV